MEIVKRMVLSQWSLADTCMCALASVLVIDINWIAARMSDQSATLAKHWTRANVCSSSMAKVVWCSTLSDSEPEQATWFLVATGFLQAVTQQHQKPKNLPNTRFKVSGKLQLSQLSTLRRTHSPLIWPFAKMETVKRCSLTVVIAWFLHVCSLFGTGDRYKLDCCTNNASIGKSGKIWTRANVCSSSMAKFLQCSAHSRSNQNRQCDS